MQDRVILSSIQQLVGHAQKNPAILNIAAFSSLSSMLTKHSRGNSDCKPCKARMVLSQYRPQFEAAMNVLSDFEKGHLKQMLDAKEVCFNRKMPNGTIQAICF